MNACLGVVRKVLFGVLLSVVTWETLLPYMSLANRHNRYVTVLVIPGLIEVASRRTEQADDTKPPLSSTTYSI